MTLTGPQTVAQSWSGGGYTSTDNVPVAYTLHKFPSVVRIVVTQGGDGKVSFPVATGAELRSFPPGLTSTAGRDATVFLFTEGDGIWRIGGNAA